MTAVRKSVRIACLFALAAWVLLPVPGAVAGTTVWLPDGFGPPVEYGAEELEKVLLDNRLAPSLRKGGAPTAGGDNIIIGKWSDIKGIVKSASVDVSKLN